MLRRLARDHEQLLGDKRAAVTLGEHVLQLAQAKRVWKIIIGEMQSFLEVPVSSFCLSAVAQTHPDSCTSLIYNCVGAHCLETLPRRCQLEAACFAVSEQYARRDCETLRYSHVTVVTLRTLLSFHKDNASMILPLGNSDDNHNDNNKK